MPEPHEAQVPEEGIPKPVEYMPEAQLTHRPNPSEYLPTEQRWHTASFVSTPMPGIMQRQMAMPWGQWNCAYVPMALSASAALPLPATVVYVPAG